MERGYADQWEPEAEAKPSPPLGLWASALFNICLFVLPLAGAYSAYLVERDRLYTYNASPAAAHAARTALDRLAAKLATPGEDRLAQWDNLVAAELMADDIHAARGMLLSARAMLAPSDADKISRAAHNDNSDADLEAAALPLLTIGTRARYEATVPLLSRSAGLAARRADTFVALGDATDFAADASADLSHPDADHLRFVLTGLGVVLRTELSPAALSGSSILRTALMARRLPSPLAAVLLAHAEAALPRARFAAEATRRAGAATAADRAAVFDAAFRASIDARALSVFEGDLAQVGAIGDSVGLEGAMALLRHARSLEDLQRLRLLAATNADRAVAIAKHAPANGAVAAAARGWLRFTPDLMIALAIAAFAGLGLACCAIATGVEALARTLQALHIIQRETPAAKKLNRHGHALVRDLR